MPVADEKPSGRHFEFTVEGRGEFPLAMLADDACYPRTTEDAMAMLLALPRQLRRGRRVDADQEPRLHRINLASDWGRPTPERWRSFGWAVSGVSQEK